MTIIELVAIILIYIFLVMPPISETIEPSPETNKQVIHKQPDIHLTHEYYLKGTNVTTLDISLDTMFFNNGMRTTDYNGFYIYEIPNTNTPKYYVHATTESYTIESVLIGENTKNYTESVLHVFLPRHVMEKITRHQIDRAHSLSGIIDMVWTGEYIIETNEPKE